MLDSNFIVEDGLLQNTEVQRERNMKQFVINCNRNGILFNQTEPNSITSILWWVDRTVADITQQKKDELSRTILLLGAFHMAKTAQHSIGMLIKNTGCLSGDRGFWCQYNWICNQWESLCLLFTAFIDTWRCSRGIKVESILEAQQRRGRKDERSVNSDYWIIRVKKQRRGKNYLCS